jgi:hypothetical protein
VNSVFEPTVSEGVPVNALSGHIIHVGFIVHERARGYGGMAHDKPTWVSQQVPDGTDRLEYMPVGWSGRSPVLSHIW